MADNADELVLPNPAAVARARSRIIKTLPVQGLGQDAVMEHIDTDIVPGLSRSSASPRYYGFVTGGATDAATAADIRASQLDQNVQVHLPRESVATDVEAAALLMLCDLLYLDCAAFPHRTLTTGATASNILGLACGREHVIRAAAAVRHGKGADVPVISVGELGLIDALRAAGLERVQILTTRPHSSLVKAAAILGLGRASVRDVGRADAPLEFDWEALRAALADRSAATIVSVSCAEVNTGFFATGAADMRALRRLCDEYRAWLHVDAAFGLQARVLPVGEEYDSARAGVEGLELADSIAGDAHKLLNVPYDCGIFFSRDLALATSVFQNPNAAYLGSNSTTTSITGSQPSNERSDTPIPSPLNIGLENSRRFRALPLYATLTAYGGAWHSDLLQRQITLARRIARLIAGPSLRSQLMLLPESAWIDLAAQNEEQREAALERGLRRVYIVVLFAAREPKRAKELVARINGQRRLYVSGTQWEGRAAARFAVANWRVDVERDIEVVREVLERAVRWEDELA